MGKLIVTKVFQNEEGYSFEVSKEHPKVRFGIGWYDIALYYPQDIEPRALIYANGQIVASVPVGEENTIKLNDLSTLKYRHEK